MVGSGSDFNPNAVAVLGGGFLVVADAAGHRVIKISSTGAITVIAGTGIPTFIIAERYAAGDSSADLAKDYGRSQEEIEEAVRPGQGGEHR